MIVIAGFQPHIISKSPQILSQVYINSAAFFDSSTIKCSMPAEAEEETETFFQFEPGRPLCFYETDHDKAALLAKLKDIYTNIFDVAEYTGRISNEFKTGDHYISTLGVNLKYCAFETKDGRIISGDFYYAGT